MALLLCREERDVPDVDSFKLVEADELSTVGGEVADLCRGVRCDCCCAEEM